MYMSVIVIGDSMVDVSYIGTATRLAQEACIPIMNLSKKTYSLGGAANVYHNLISMGTDTILVSVIGDDEYGKFLQTEIKLLNQDSYLLQDERITTSKHRFYVNNKIIFRYDNEVIKSISTLSENLIFQYVKDNSSQTKIIILSDYNKGFLTNSLVKNIITFANSKNIKVFVDPKTKDVSKYSECFMIKPNRTEGEILCGHKIDNPIDGTKEICSLIHSNLCLLTLSEDGMILYDSNSKEYIQCHASKNDVVDITGAGDIVLAGFTFYYLQTYDLRKSVEFANYCGQLKIKNFGTYVISKYDILIFNNNSKVIETFQLEKTIDIIKRANKKIIFTNGCYDILHYGHLTFLENARSYGDILIVGLNSDQSVKMNKGDSRPINNLARRIKQMSALSCVDFIVVFDEKTPLELLSRIHPDILVKGGDYQVKDVIGKEYAKEVKILNYLDGYSTSAIIANSLIPKN